jgi:DNA modification methylase
MSPLPPLLLKGDAFEVTPAGGCVVDPFAGSGTTLEAAYLEGFESIGIELTPEFWPLVEARIARATQG